MGNEIIKIKKENVIAVYRAASEDKQELLELLFGKELFKSKDVKERIKTFDDAIQELGDRHPCVMAYREWMITRPTEQKDIKAYLKLRVICAALNEGWEPKFGNGECRYYPWFWFYTEQEIRDMTEEKKTDSCLIPIINHEAGYAGFGYAHSNNAPSATVASLGSRLCLKDERLAVYCGKQFIEIWADFLLIRK